MHFVMEEGKTLVGVLYCQSVLDISGCNLVWVEPCVTDRLGSKVPLHVLSNSIDPKRSVVIQADCEQGAIASYGLRSAL